jgi:lysozyme
MPRSANNAALLVAIIIGFVFFNRTTFKEFAVTVSENALDLIRKLEGFSPKAYRDAGGYSIGYGHYMGQNATMETIDHTTAENLLAQDTAKADGTIRKYVAAPLNQNQRDALVSATFNLGTALFWNSAAGRKTNFLQALNAGDYVKAADLLLTFNHSMGKVNPSLVARREAERQLFLS